MSDYDSTEDTTQHIKDVGNSLNQFSSELLVRAAYHDESSLQEPEKSFFDKWRPILSGMPYGSPEYMQALEGLKPALKHHYELNRHHPEHFSNGINDMNLADLIEMLCDWQAAIKRKGGTESIFKSIEINKTRFGISEQLAQILTNTAKTMGWQ